jgi:branched chain amino acid efflux pump
VQLTPETLVAIVAMAVVTYATRIGGLVIMPRIPTSPWLDRFVALVPGTVLAALVAPAVFREGPPELVAAAVTVVVARRGSGLLLPVVAGVVAVLALRSLFAA